MFQVMTSRNSTTPLLWYSWTTQGRLPRSGGSLEVSRDWWWIYDGFADSGRSWGESRAGRADESFYIYARPVLTIFWSYYSQIFLPSSRHIAMLPPQPLPSRCYNPSLHSRRKRATVPQPPSTPQRHSYPTVSCGTSSRCTVEMGSLSRLELIHQLACNLFLFIPLLPPSSFLPSIFSHYLTTRSYIFSPGEPPFFLVSSMTDTWNLTNLTGFCNGHTNFSCHFHILLSSFFISSMDVSPCSCPSPVVETNSILRVSELKDHLRYRKRNINVGSGQ